MITNERQLRISKAELEKLQNAAIAFDIHETTNRVGSETLAKLELAALESEVENLSTQIQDYEALKSGNVSVLKADSLSGLPSILIRARIARGLSQRDLAGMLNLKEQQIQRYESDEYVSASLRRLAEVAHALGLNISEVAELNPEKPRAHIDHLDELDWNCFPIKEMYQRGWFEGFSGSLKAAISEGDALVKAFVSGVFGRRAIALNRQRVRTGSTANRYSLLAWQCHVICKSRIGASNTDYKRSMLDETWFRNVVQLSRFDDGPLQAKKFLEKSGIAVVIEPSLPQTHLDGAAMLDGTRPVIGLTLRYDRLDNFWFVLLHELIHVVKHLKKGQIEDIFDDLDGEADEIEKEADVGAAEVLLSENIWKSALARFVRTNNSVSTLAKELKICPAIIAGRIRNEADNYVILGDLVGQGQVRKHFPEINFGKD